MYWWYKIWDWGCTSMQCKTEAKHHAKHNFRVNNDQSRLKMYQTSMKRMMSVIFIMKKLIFASEVRCSSDARSKKTNFFSIWSWTFKFCMLRTHVISNKTTKFEGQTSNRKTVTEDLSFFESASELHRISDANVNFFIMTITVMFGYIQKCIWHISGIKLCARLTHNIAVQQHSRERYNTHTHEIIHC